MFQYEKTAKQFYEMLIERMKKFNLELAIDKTIILAFGRFKGTVECFNFLGFTFTNGNIKDGKYKTNIKMSKRS